MKEYITRKIKSRRPSKDKYTYEYLSNEMCPWYIVIWIF
jgi:hypothetical protein